MSKRSVRAVLVSGANLSALIPELQHDSDIEVVAHVPQADRALASVLATHPNIVVLDLELAGAQAAIAEIMDRAPTPILTLFGSTDGTGSTAAGQALVAGALEVLPTSGREGARLRETVHRLSKARVIRHLRGRVRERPAAAGTPTMQSVVAMAASTGGPSALAQMLAALANLEAPILIVQHLHPDFTKSLFEWMARVSALPVEVGCDGQEVQPGRVYLAPAGVHMRLGKRLRLELTEDPPNVHRPSADVLFESVAQNAGAAGIGVLLTGMGEDGARGLLAIRRSGGQSLAQDENSCAVFGMPRAALRLRAVARLQPLDELPGAIRLAVRHAHNPVPRTAVGTGDT